MSLLDFLQRRRATDKVVITDAKIIRTTPGDREESSQLDELSEVQIVATDEGPFSKDVFFLLVGSDEKSGCAVPLSAEGFGRLLARLQELPGFNNEAVITAMGSTTNAGFVCWSRGGTCRS